MKLKKKTVNCIGKYVVCLVLLCSFLINILLLSAWAVDEIPVASNSAYDMHEYQEGIVDGGLYYLHNVGNGGYLTVDNGSADLFATLSTAPLNNAAHQKFCIEYMGSSIYRMWPQHAQGLNDPYANNGKMYLCAEWRESGDLISLYGVTQFWGGYRLEALGDNKFIIFTEASGFTCAVTIDASNSNQLIQKTYNSMTPSEKLYAQWVFETADVAQYSSYSKFYVRNIANNAYLDVSDPSRNTVCAAPFSGAEAQQWKKTNAPVEDRYYLSPMNDLYDYLGVGNDKVYTGMLEYEETEKHRQHLELEFFGYVDGSPAYRIVVYVRDGSGNLSIKKYLNVGSLAEGSANTYEVTYSDSTGRSSLWVFEQILTETGNPVVLTLNQWHTSTMVASEGTTRLFAIAIDKTARYKVELSGTNVAIGTIQGPISVTELERKTYNGLQILDVFVYSTSLESVDVYYVPVVYTGDGGEENVAFQVRVRQLSFVGHSNDDSSDNTEILYFHEHIDVAEDSLEEMNYKVTHRQEIKKSQAVFKTDPLTGYKDFNADIFAYTGHGTEGAALYDEFELESSSSGSTILLSTQLPQDMSNCQLAVWLCCKSASDTTISSMARASVENGAKTAIGFSSGIYNDCTEMFFDRFCYYLTQGVTVQRATINARTDLLNWAERIAADYPLENVPEKAGEMVESMRIFGDANNVIFPRQELNSISTTNANLTTSEHARLLNRAAYTLIVDDLDSGIKRYVRMINGIPTDDYFVEFYEGNTLVQIYKSQHTLTDEEVTTANAKVAEMIAINSTSQAVGNADEAEFLFIRINGELQLLRKEVVHAEECCTCEEEYVFYDAITNEVIE